MVHKPVLLTEVIAALDPKPGQRFIDGTCGQGGHSKAILEKTGPNGRVMGMDLDPKQIDNASHMLEAFGDRFVPVNDSYHAVGKYVAEKRFGPVAGVLLDLGFSSWQMEQAGRGFSFLKDEELDMRYDQQGNPVTAKRIINDWPEQELEKIFEKYGEEKFARRIAKKIAQEREKREISTTFELAEAIKDATPSSYWRQRIHYATRVFQALRIAVNGELENLALALPACVEALAAGGRLAIISFHSLEDRQVKNFFKTAAENGSMAIITKKPIEAGPAERAENPRARSAKLRVAQKN